MSMFLKNTLILILNNTVNYPPPKGRGILAQIYMKSHTDIEQSIEEIQKDLETIKQKMYKITFIPKHMLSNHK